jgi:hypothetical protein
MGQDEFGVLDGERDLCLWAESTGNLMDMVSSNTWHGGALLKNCSGRLLSLAFDTLHCLREELCASVLTTARPFQRR